MNRTSIGDLAGQRFDMLIIGGGVTGAAALRDAALRGLTAVLVEKGDFAGGTSSRSTKLLHGGLRYLQQFEFKLVREACQERELMLKLAPHLSAPRPFIYLVYDGYPEGMFMVNLGLTIYDWFARIPQERRHRMLSAKELAEVEPYLNREGLRGGGWYYDNLTDDARLTIDTLKAACDAGALAANYMEVTELLFEGGRVRGARVTDRLTGETGEIHAKVVISAAGVWTDQVRALDPSVKERRMRPTKGVHIALRKEDFPLNHAVFLRSPRDGRVVWPIPALDGDLVYVGTTDTDYQGDLDHVVPTDDDIDYLLEVANHTIPGRNLTREHIVSAWAGLRPLLKPAADVSASKTSREHEIMVSPGGLVSIAGGKMTTCRVMGQQVVDAALTELEKEHGMKGAKPSTTHLHPISGGDIGPDFCTQVSQVAERLGLKAQVADRLASRYGGNFFAIAREVEADPAAGEPMNGTAITPAEVRYAVREEMARTLTDFMDRRSSLLYWRWDGGMAIAGQVAQEMGQLLAWTPAERERQVAAYAAWVSANRAYRSQK